MIGSMIGRFVIVPMFEAVDVRKRLIANKYTWNTQFLLRVL